MDWPTGSRAPLQTRMPCLSWKALFLLPSHSVGSSCRSILSTVSVSGWKTLQALKLSLVAQIKPFILPQPVWLSISLIFNESQKTGTLSTQKREDLGKMFSPSSQLQGRMNYNKSILLPPFIFKLALIPRRLFSRVCCSDLGQYGSYMKDKTHCVFSTTH